MAIQYDVILKEHPPQFEIHTDGDVGYLVFARRDGNMVLMHTYVPEKLRSRGIADQLAKYSLEYAREKNIKVVVYCPFVSAYLKRHPEYMDVVKVIAPKD